MKRVLAILKDRTAATAIEYTLIAALIALAAVTAMQGIGDQLGDTFNDASSMMANDG